MTRLMRRNSASGEHDPVELEAAARAAYNKAKQAEAAPKDSGLDLEVPRVEAFSKGVYTASEEFDHVPETTSPLAPRPNGNTVPKNTVPKSTVPVSVAKPSAPVAPALGGGWAPAGFAQANKALSEPAAPYPVGTPLEQAVSILGDALREERKRTAAAEERAERLASEMEKLRQKMTEQATIFAQYAQRARVSPACRPACELAHVAHGELVRRGVRCAQGHCRQRLQVKRDGPSNNAWSWPTGAWRRFSRSAAYETRVVGPLHLSVRRCWPPTPFSHTRHTA